MEHNIDSVPHLTTALSAPLHHIEQHLLARQTEIEAWFRSKWRDHEAPFYTSIDVRNAGFKVAPVDTNLFPAGFNNLNPAFEPLCVQAIQLVAERYRGTADKVLIIVESHSRNLHYLENLYVLQQMMTKAGLETRLGSIDPLEQNPTQLKTASSKSLEIYPICRQDDRLTVGDFVPGLIVLNNDLASGIPSILQGIQQQLTPSPELGWSQRLKSAHFGHYKQTAEEFSELLSLDPWLIDPLFRNCSEVDFMQREGLECLSYHTDTLLREIHKKYREYNVDNRPFVFIKADAGTYGMAVMAVHDATELNTLNRKQRTRMSTTKERKPVHRVIIQEGVHTHETWGDAKASAEPVVYCVGHHVVGGFYRVHPSRTDNENLNSPGMHFEPLAFADCCASPHMEAEAQKEHPNRFYLYGVVARLAVLAASLERGQIEKPN